MKRIPIKRRPKIGLTKVRKLKFTPEMDRQMTEAAEKRGIFVAHWIRQAIDEKLKREGGDG